MSFWRSIFYVVNYMNVKNLLLERSASKCELCNSEIELQVFNVTPKSSIVIDNNILVCKICNDQLAEKTNLDLNHWHCLNESMWSEVSAVKVIAWRMLNNLSEHVWAQDALEMIYLEADDMTWAKDGFTNSKDGYSIIHKDSNGTILSAGDTVTLTKSLDVKGASFTAKRGTAVRNISLVIDNDAQIEGRVNGQKIVILTKFVKKS